MIRARQSFYEDHPDPMWIFDPKSLFFLDVNKAALAKYGYSRDEFVGMTLADIRPIEDLPNLRASVANLTDGRDEVGHWRHLLKSGVVIDVSVTICSIEIEGRVVKLAAVRDITQIVEMERKARSVANIAAQKFAKFFDAVPGKCAIIVAGSYEVVAASDAYLAASGMHRREVIGRNLFEVFPDFPAATSADGVSNLTASFKKVEESALPDTLPLQRYATKPIGSANKTFEERFWSVVNTPILANDGSVEFIVHRVEELTLLVEAARRMGLEEVATSGSANPVLQLSLEVMLRAQELKSANTQLMDQAVNLRTAQRLLAIGFFTIDLISDTVTCSENTYDLLGIKKSTFSFDSASFIELIDPRDRVAAVAAMKDNMALGAKSYEFSHRIVRPTGGVIHVRGICEITKSPGYKVLSGVFQDVTTQMADEADKKYSVTLARVAGKIAKLGAWRLDINPTKIHWSPETAEIHGRPGLQYPDIDEALNFYAPEYRESITSALNKCISSGQPFDEMCQIITTSGKRIWVRAIGEAERDLEGAVVAVQGAFQDVSEIVEMRQTANALESRLAKTIEGMSEAFMTLDRDWRYSFLNKQAEKLLRRSRADLLGKIIWDEFPSGRGSSYQTEFENAVRTQISVRFKAYYPAPLNVWFEVSANPIPEGLAVYFRDVTEDQKKTRQLQLLEKSLSQITDMVIITEAAPLNMPDGPKIVFVNNSFTQQTGFTFEEAIGNTPRILQGPATDKAILTKVRAALQIGESINAELLNYTKAGVEYWNEVEISPIIDEQGSITNFVSVQRDITERKNAEQQLRISEERFRLLVSTSRAVVKDMDLISRKVWLTDNMEQYFGDQIEFFDDFLAVWRRRIHPDDAELVIAKFDAALASEMSDWQDQYRLILPTGDIVILVERSHFIRNDAGQPLRIIGSYVDVTAEQEELERKRQSQKLEAMGQLTGGVAHDFNNLLTIILGNSEIMMQDCVPEELRRLAKMTNKAAEHAAALTARLLAFSRKQPLEPKPVAMNSLVASMEGLVRRTLAENVAITFKLSEVSGWINVDTNQWEIALLNLAINARDAMPDGGELVIETSNITIEESDPLGNPDFSRGEYVLLEVTDTGIGMSKKVVDRIFEPFYTTKDVGLGSGLGLSMVYGFVKQSGGQISVHSEPGVGTSFKVYLPRVPLQVFAAAVETKRNNIAYGTEKILVVEDDESVKEHLVGQLEWLGYRVYHAANGNEALVVLRLRNDIELLLTDVVLSGGIDGCELATKAKLLFPNLKILYTSGYTKNAMVHSGQLNTDVELLSKPYRRQELARKIRKVLD